MSEQRSKELVTRNRTVFKDSVIALLASLSISYLALPSTARQLGPDEGYPEVRWDEASNVIGRVAFVSGKIVSVGHSNSMHFLNFEEQRPGRFTVVIPTAHLSKFKPNLEALYQGKLVRVRGVVKTYRGRAQIEATDPAQIQVVESLPEARPPVGLKTTPSPTITVATYNILNLFDDVDDPYRADEGTPAKPKAQMERVARTIRELNADVIGLQEVETREYLQRFVDAYLADMGYQVVLFEGNDPRGIDVALLSRLPVGEVRSHRHVSFPGPQGSPMRFKRDVLAVEILPPAADPFEVWVLHLQSNYEGREYAEPVRLAEARQVRAMLEARFKSDSNARILVMGDFNDTFESAGVQAIVGAGAHIMKSFADELPTEQRITYNKDPYRSMIDFILFSPTAAQRFVPGSFRIIAGSTESTGSDHNPVAVTFRSGWEEPSTSP